MFARIARVGAIFFFERAAKGAQAVSQTRTRWRRPHGAPVPRAEPRLAVAVPEVRVEPLLLARGPRGPLCAVTASVPRGPQAHEVRQAS